MLFQRSILAVAAGFGLLQAGCFAQGNEMGVEGIDHVGFDILTMPPPEEDPSDPTNTTRNGLETWKFHAQKSNLASAFLESLYDNGGMLNPHVQTLLATGNTAGHDVFKYAAKCMVPFATNIVIAGQETYKGRGLLNMSGVWPNWGLGFGGANEGFACMAAHLNPSGMPVPLKLTGIPIQVPVDPNAPPDAYMFKEALWAADLNASGALTIHVWPLNDLYAKCVTATNDALVTRVCGTPTGSCGLVVHSSAAAECTESTPGVYSTCLMNGTTTNVIQTWLDPMYVDNLYGSCVPSRGR